MLIIALAPVGCLTTSFEPTGVFPAHHYSPVPADSVRIFARLEEVTDAYEEIGYLVVSAPTGFDLVRSPMAAARSEAGKLGANALILPEHAKHWTRDILEHGDSKRSAALAIRVLPATSATPGSCVATVGAAPGQEQCAPIAAHSATDHEMQYVAGWALARRWKFDDSYRAFAAIDSTGNDATALFGMGYVRAANMSFYPQFRDRIAVEAAFRRALHLFQRALSLDPTNARIGAHLGYVLFLTGADADAESRLRESLARQNDTAWVHAILARVLRQRGRNEEALAEARTAARLAPNDAECYSLVASFDALAGRDAEANAYWARALQLDPELLKTHAFWHRANLYQERELYDHSLAAAGPQEAVVFPVTDENRGARCTWPEDIRHGDRPSK